MTIYATIVIFIAWAGIGFLGFLLWTGDRVENRDMNNERVTGGKFQDATMIIVCGPAAWIVLGDTILFDNK